MISNELLEEVINVSKKDKFISRELIIKIIMYTILNLDKITQKKFNGFWFTDELNALGMCYTREGYVALNLNECYGYAASLKDTTMLQKNLELICDILHEFEHLKEMYKISKNDFQGKLLKVADLANNYDDAENHYYAYISNPSEKIASAMPFKNMLENIKNYTDFQKHLFDGYKYISNRYFEELVLGYKKIAPGKYNIPLIVFFKHINKLEYLKDESFKKSLKSELKNGSIDLEKKFMYGLKVTQDEVKQLAKRKF